MKRPEIEILTEKQQIQQAKELEFLLGVQCGAYVSKQLIQSGWTDMEKFEAEVLRRIRGRKPRPFTTAQLLRRDSKRDRKRPASIAGGTRSD